jgi:ribonuclease HII
MIRRHPKSKEIQVAGCDEAGRGCLAGPVVAGAVILPRGKSFSKFNDSKKLTAAKREILFEEIKEVALAWGIGIVSPEEIDEMNILNASFEAMHRAIGKLNVQPELLIIDGNRFNPYKEIPFECVVKGDGKYQEIAAASILAKVQRDRIMKELDLENPGYEWSKNKGYPTKAHRAGIEKIGPSPHHRKSFQLLPAQIKIPFDHP